MVRVYAKALFSRAWRDAWHSVIAHSALDLAKKVIVGALVLALLFLYVKDHPLSTALEGQELVVRLTVEAIFITFAGLFAINLLLVAPYQLWRATGERAGQTEERYRGQSPPAPQSMYEDDKPLAIRVQQFALHYLGPATDAATEAQRLSAYVFKDTWGDTPAGKWGYYGIQTGASYDPSLLRALKTSATSAFPNLDVLQEALLKTVQTYALKTHRIQEILIDFKTHGKLTDMHGFFAALRTWWKTHQELLVAFERLKETNGLPILRDYKMTLYLLDPNFGFEQFEGILHG